MRSLLFMALTAASFAALASTPVRLDNLQTHKLAHGGSSITGTCGSAPVSITGFTPFAADAERIGMLDPDTYKTLPIKITAGGVILTPEDLQDSVSVNCQTTKKGPRLVIASYCDGNGGCNHVDYIIVDPNNGKRISPSPADGCDEQCATKILGVTPQ